MATEILKSFSHLQSELEEAKSSLKGVDENIKRLIGRDPSDLPPRQVQKRPLDDKNSRQPFSKFSRGFENDDNSKRRNPNAISVFKRLSDKVPDEPVKAPSRGIISKVIAAPKEVPSRQAVLDKQNKDEKFKARNRRMFGALLGTLQRFQQDECKLKKREDKRTQIEKKIEEHEQQEKEEIKKERQELFLNRKKKQQEIKMIELKMLRMKEYAAWEQSQKPRSHFILTKAKPHIHYRPRRIDNKSKDLLEKSKKDIEEQIEKRRQAVSDELSHIEERMKRNFDMKNNVETKEVKSTDHHNRRGSDSELDEEDVHMKTLSPEPKEDTEMKDEAPNSTTPKEEEKEESTSINTNNNELKEETSDNIALQSDVQSEESTVVNNVDGNVNVEIDALEVHRQSSEVSTVNVNENEPQEEKQHENI